MNTELLSDALGYHARGLLPLPMRIATNRKKPLVEYRELQRGSLPDEKWVKECFAIAGVNGIGIHPRDTGVAVRDFDTMAGYQRFTERHPALARSLPTVRTKRGRHVWCQSDLAKTKRRADGEYRGAGLSVAPRSMRGGFIYDWIIPLPSGPLPFVESAILMEEHVSENSEAISEVSDSSDFSDTSSPSRIIELTLPMEAGQRNNCILKLARGIKFNAGMGNADTDQLRRTVQEWHRRALPIIDTKDFDTTWADFLHGFERARYPLGTDLVDEAALRVDPDDLPEVAANYTGIPTRRLIGLCSVLGSFNRGKFFLSSHDAAPRIGVTQPQAWRLLRMLETDGVIECLERGWASTSPKFRKAGRYRWLAGRLPATSSSSADVPPTSGPTEKPRPQIASHSERNR